MNGFTSLEPDFSDFVEVDPTGRYGRYNEVLGKGASKIVYRGFDEYEGIEVAWNQVKLYDFLQRPEDVERLYSEIHLLKTLKHKNIMKFYTSWVDVANRNINFVTEMFTSGTLRQYRQKHKRVNIRAIKHWCRQILKGLLYLHSLDPPVIHRDLKCDNIFINGNQGEVKIGDLGLAAILHKSHAAHCVGTPEFMAPEVYNENYNELVDIYSFGMSILEMVTFEYPYSECSNPVQIYQKVMNGKKPDALYKVKDPEVRRFIGTCLATSSLRLSARELLNDSFLQIDDCEANLRPPRKLEDMGRVQRQLLIQHSSEKSLSNEYYGDHCKLVDIEINDVELFTYNEDKHSKTMDITIKGKKKEDDEIFLRLKITDKEGFIRNIYFSFDIETDTALSVATEMVTELDITDQDVTMIADMIDSEIAFLVPEWQAGLAIEETPRHSSVTFCRNCASNGTSNSPLRDYLSLNNEGANLNVLPCLKDGCASMHGRFEEVTYQVEETELSFPEGAPVLSSQSDGDYYTDIWDQYEGYELSLEGSGELDSESKEQLNISDFDRNAIIASYNIEPNGRKRVENVPGHHPPPNTPTSSCAVEEEYENEIWNELSWIKTMYQKESSKLKNGSLGRHSRAPSWSPETSNWQDKTETLDSSPISTQIRKKSNKVLFKSFGSGKNFSCYIAPIQNNSPDSETQRGRLCEATIVSMSPERVFAARSIYGTPVRPRAHHRTTSLLVDV